jgi:glycosyltransferase involved in cell wall biosynthesis
MFGHEWKADRRWSVLHCGIDLDPFNHPAQHIRNELGFHSEDIIFGHVGRFVEQKNHRFLVDVVERLISLVPRAKFLWIGEGCLQPTIEARLRALGIRDRVTILARCSNVPALMRGAMDAFLFPSKYEGLGLAVVEAQAAGLPCFIADRVPTDADVVHPLVQRLSLLESPEHWASAIARTVQQNRPVSAYEALEAVRRSSFNIESSVRRLEELYRERP